MTDQELLTHFYADNDLQWIGLLLERYTLLLLGVCMKYLKHEEEAKDSVQQIFLKVLTEVPKYKIDYFKSWLYMVAKNHCLMKLRAKGTHTTKDITSDNIPASESNRHEAIESERTYSLLEEAIHDLNEEQRQCVLLFFVEKKSYAEISEQTGYTVLQVKSFLQNGKRNLKLILERKLQENKNRT